MASATLLGLIQAVANQKTKVDLKTIADTLENYGASYGIPGFNVWEEFVAQAAQETDKFMSLREYASGAAYEGRTDLGNTQPGDGVKFRGRGIFMITGRSNYKAVSQALFSDDRLLTNPEILESPKYAALSALYYWKSRNLTPLAIANDFEAITKKINGGLNGWKERLSMYEKAKLFLQNNPEVTTAAGYGVAAVILVVLILLYIKYKPKFNLYEVRNV